MFRPAGLAALLVLPALGQAPQGSPQDPFKPLDFSAPPPVLTRNQAREDWVQVTNQRMVMANRPIRVGMEGTAAVILVPGVEKPRHAKPYLLGKDDAAALFKSIVALGFERIIVRNPANGKQWSARLDRGKAEIED